MTKKDIKRQKVKDTFFKVLHIICYVLSTLFILICVIAGFNSCSNSKNKTLSSNLPQQQLNIKKAFSNGDLYSVYEFKYIDVPTLTLTTNNQVTIANDKVDVTSATSSTSHKYISIGLTGGYVSYKSSNDLYEANYIVYDYAPFAFDSYTSYYRINEIYIYFFDTNGNNLFRYIVHNPVINNNGSMTYDIGDDTIELIFNEKIDDTMFTFFFEPHDTYNFIFNQSFNYNAPANSTTLSPYVTTVNFTSSTNDTGYIDYDTGFFLSNNEIFNKIRVYYFASGSMYFKYDDSTIKLGPSGSWSYMFMYYINTYSNNQVLVNSRDLIAFMPTSSSYGYYNANSSTWKNNEFRFLIFFDSLSDNTRIAIQSFNNNSFNSYGSNVYGNSDVFTLLSQAFYSLSDFWSINILPGISIGVLFFLPLIVGVIIIIVKLLKK